MSGLHDPEEQEFIKLLKEQISIEEPFGDIHRKFTIYQQALVEYNQKFSLVSNADIKKIWLRHFWDSLVPLNFFSSQHFGEAVDVGSGAGFPGIALGIARREMRVDLVECNSKKHFFLSELISRLSLKNCRAVCDRAENLGHKEDRREKYKWAFTRALAKPETVFELLLPFLKVGGKAVFWASGEEWSRQGNLEKMVRTFGGEWVDQKIYRLPLDQKSYERKLVLIEKTAVTDKRYPRRTGVPQKKRYPLRRSSP